MQAGMVAIDTAVDTYISASDSIPGVGTCLMIGNLAYQVSNGDARAATRTGVKMFCNFLLYACLGTFVPPLAPFVPIFSGALSGVVNSCI